MGTNRPPSSPRQLLHLSDRSGKGKAAVPYQRKKQKVDTTYRERMRQLHGGPNTQSARSSTRLEFQYDRIADHKGGSRVPGQRVSDRRGSELRSTVQGGSDSRSEVHDQEGRQRERDWRAKSREHDRDERGRDRYRDRDREDHDQERGREYKDREHDREEQDQNHDHGQIPDERPRDSPLHGMWNSFTSSFTPENLDQANHILMS